MRRRERDSFEVGTLSFWRDTVVIVALVIAGLYLGQRFFIPLTLAFMVFVLLIAVVDSITKREIRGRTIPVWVAYLLATFMILFGIITVVRFIAHQATDVVAAIPKYEERFDLVLSGLAEVLGREVTGSIVKAVQDIELSSHLGGMLGSAGSIVSSLLLVALYVPFMLIERRPMRTKVRIAVDDPELSQEIQDVATSVSIGLQRYIGIKTFVSILTGLYSYAILKLLGIDFAETWAILTFALNYIPSIGSILAVIMPALVSLVQFDTITPFLIVVFGCGIGQFLLGNVLEPALTGKSLNVSTMLVILSLTFWSALWGIPGAFLSVPITVSMMILFASVPNLRWIAVLMSANGDLSWLDNGIKADEKPLPETLDV
jgi:AI-2 transport protein TqsA